MRNKIYIELFRFNKDTDYLPYYTKYNMDCQNIHSVSDLLTQMNKVQTFGCNNIDDCYVKINNLYIHSSQKLEEVLDEVGEDIVIEPISTKRAMYDLNIDTSDYDEKLELLSKFMTDEDMVHYKKQYILEYYASNSLNINNDYIGDHVLLIASDIIEKSPEYKDEILSILNDKNSGMLYHTDLNNRVFQYCSTKQNKIYNLLGRTIEDKNKTSNAQIDVIQEFKGFNIASYDGIDKNYELKKTIESSKATYVDCISKNDDMALHMLDINESFALKIAGNILLEAKDKNADFLIVNSEKELDIFDKKQKNIEKTMGRDILLPIVTKDQFIKLLSGEKDNKKLGFDKHSTQITFL